MTDSFSKFVGASIGAHVTLILLFTMRALMFPNQAIDLRNAIRVDMVGLPEKAQTLPENKPAPPAPAPVAKEKPVPVAKPKVPDKPTVDLSKKAKPDVAKSEKKALDQIKQMAALDKIKTEMASKHAVRGNIVAAGDSLTGTEKIDFDRYFGQVEDRIRQNWSLPQWLVDSHLRAQTLVLIDESGLVKKKQIVKSSGNSEFDSRMLDAIDKSSPFPPPPDRLRNVLGIQGIVFNFPQRGDS